LRVRLPQAAMPRNTEGKQIHAAIADRNDGFSPGSTIVVRVPGLDNPGAVEKTDPVPLSDMSEGFKRRAPIVLIDAKTGQRQLIWAELDSNAGSPRKTTLLIHPAKSLADGRRYIVAMRHLKDKGGRTLGAPSWFKRLRDRKPLPLGEGSQR